MSPSYLVTVDRYEQNREQHINPNSYMYGAVLVVMETKTKGWSLTIEYDNTHVSVRPRFSWRYNKWATWMGMCIRVVRTTKQVPGKVIRDHLSEANS